MVDIVKEKPKKAWHTPELIEHGTVSELTLSGVKCKRPGSLDDFGVSGISDAPTC